MGAMATDQDDKVKSLRRINEILNKSYARVFSVMASYTTVQCRVCEMNFYLDTVSEAPQITYGVISDAHGEVKGYQFRFPCPHCKTPLRVDEDEIDFCVRADADKNHS